MPDECIALVDDDRNILASVSMALESEGYRVITYPDGEAALAGIDSNPPDLAVLDIKMPRMDGLELLQKLKEKHPALPAIFLTSKDDEIDELMGLRLGADDYIRKPFSQRLLIERIRVLLRRTKALTGPPASAGDAGGKEEDTEGRLVRGGLVLDTERHLCTWKGVAVNITVTEFLLLKCLAERPGHVKNRDQLIDHAYGKGTYVDDRTIDSHIKRLRRKFRAIDPAFSGIETLYGVGYRYRENP